MVNASHLHMNSSSSKVISYPATSGEPVNIQVEERSNEMLPLRAPFIERSSSLMKSIHEVISHQVLYIEMTKGDQLEREPALEETNEAENNNNLSNICKEGGSSMQAVVKGKIGKTKREISIQPTRVLARRGVKSSVK